MSSRSALFLVCCVLWGCGAKGAAPAESASVREPGKERYVRHCGRCHDAYPAYSYSDAQWRGIFPKMRPLTSMTEPEAESVLQWLQDNN